MTIYYTYCSYETDKGTEGLLYIGFRKCPEGKTPETDNYFGTQTSKKNQDFKNNPNKDKVILGVFDSKDDAIAHEIKLHNLHDVAKNPGFANQAKQTSTGFSTAGLTGERNHMAGKKLKPETCGKISERMKGEKNPNFGKFGENHHWFGKKHSPEACQKMVSNSRGQSGNKNPMYGKNHSPETLQQMSEARRGEKNPGFDHTLYDFENKELGVVEMKVTQYHLRNKYGLNQGNLWSVAKGKCRQHKGWTLFPPNPKDYLQGS